MKILEKIKSKGSKVDPLMKEALRSKASKENAETLIYHINTGGKRVRPFLAITSCQLCGGKFKDVKWTAATLELLHQYTLIVDDIIDNGEIRRNQETVWVKYGKPMAECAHMHYSATLHGLTHYSKNPKRNAKLISETLKTITEGEIKDILMEQGGRDSEYIEEHRIEKEDLKEYLDMVGKKTAKLIESSCRMGALDAEASKKQVKALTNYGKKLGIAYQMIDDYLDIQGSEGKFGKEIGKDLKEQKLGNLLVLLALKEPGKKKEKLKEILRKKELTGEDIKKGVSLIRSTGAPEKAYKKAKKYAKKAKDHLEIFSDNKYKDQLIRLANLVVKRRV